MLVLEEWIAFSSPILTLARSDKFPSQVNGVFLFDADSKEAKALHALLKNQFPNSK